MAKRRNVKNPEKPEEQLSREERRARHKKEKDSPKARARSSSGRFYGFAIGGGITAAIVAIIVVLLVFAQPHPCLAFSGTPQGEYPAFPPSGTTDFSGTWCPQNAPLVLQMTDRVVIQITSTTVTLPGGIGKNSSYPGNTACELPIQTSGSAASGGDPSGLVTLASPWAYSYNLSQFFYVWSQTYSTVYVNSSFPQQPIEYTDSNLLGFTPDATHQIVLLVNGQASSAGPSLELNSLPYGSSPYPSCLTNQYGSGHVITLDYQIINPNSASFEVPVTLATDPAPAPSDVGSAPGSVWLATTLWSLDSINPSHWLSLRGF